MGGVTGNGGLSPATISVGVQGTQGGLSQARLIEPESSGPLSWLGLDPGVLEGCNTGRREFRSTEALTWLGLDPGISQAFIASAWLSGSSGPLSWLSLDPGIYYLSL